MKNNFTYRDIKSGYLVEFNNGEIFMKMRSGDFDPILVSQSDNIIELKNINPDEQIDKGDSAGKIVKVYGLPKDPRTSLMFSTSGRSVLYKYEEPKKENKGQEESKRYFNATFNNDKCEISGECNNNDMLNLVKHIIRILCEKDVPYTIIFDAIFEGFQEEK